MPVMTRQEARALVPFFRKKGGGAVLELGFTITGLDRFNAAYDAAAEGGNEGPAFARALLDYQGADYLVGGSEVLRHLPEGPFIVIANHVYGGHDGVSMIDLIGHFRPDVRVMVNEILMYLRALRPSFIAVNPTGEVRTAPTAKSLQGVKEAILHLRDGHPLGIFPAGAVSDLSVREGFRIRDREWQEAAVRLIKKARVPILPMRFFDRNTLYYYLLGLISWKVRLLRLPTEIINKGGRRTRIGIGPIISPEEQDRFTDIGAFRDFLRQSVYGMPLPETFISRSEIYRMR